MNHKNFYFVLIAFFTASVSAESSSTQELQEQIAAKQKELRELTEKVMAQEKFIQECASNFNTYIDRHLGNQSSVDDKPYKEALRECSNFFEQFFADQKKDILFDMFIKEDSKMNFAKFYFLCIFYEKKVLKELIKKWEKAAKQLNKLQDQISRSSGR